MQLVTISDKYISYLKSFPELENVRENKHGDISRPYVALEIQINKMNYYIPLEHKQKIKLNKRFNTYFKLSEYDKNGKVTNRLGGCIISNMIPVPKSETEPIKIEDITDNKYKMLLYNQWKIIKKNKIELITKANKLYKEYTNYKNATKQEDIDKAIFYLKNGIVTDFKIAEAKCQKYILDKIKESKIEKITSSKTKQEEQER